MIQSRVEKDGGFSVNLSSIYDTWNGFSGQFVVKNDTDKIIYKPEITFTANFKLQSNWAYDILETSDNVYIIRSKYDKIIIIAPNGQISLEISGTKINNAAPQISDVSLTEVTVLTENFVQKDSDMDGVPDYYETILGTNKYTGDSDYDNLPDGYEVFTLGSDPLKWSTDNSDISDGEQDFDDDGLSDGDEVHIYGTNPLNPDSDEDGMDDGVEVFLGLDPLNSDTWDTGVIDSEKILTQPLMPSKYSAFDISETGIMPEITFVGKGDFNKKVDIVDSVDNTAVSELNYLVGHPFDVQHDEDLIFESSTLSFEVSDKIIEIYGIEDLCIAYFDTETGSIEPINTIVIAENKISAQIEHYSTYIVISKTALYDFSRIDNPEDVLEKSNADIVFIIDKTGSMSGKISDVKNNIANFAKKIEESGIKSRFGLIDFGDIECGEPTIEHPWSYTAEQLQKELSKIEMTYGGHEPESAVDGLEAARNMRYFSGSPKFYSNNRCKL